MTSKSKHNKRVIEEIDDVSSESSLESDEDPEVLEQYMQECYYNSY